MTVTLKKTDKYGYGISFYQYYYLDEASEPKVDITGYDTFIYDYENHGNEPVAAEAYQGTMYWTNRVHIICTLLITVR